MVGDQGERRMFVQGRIPSHWLVDQMPEAIWATDGALRFVVVGGSAARHLGLEADRVLGTSVYDYFQTTDPTYPPLAAHLHALQGQVESYRFEYGGRVFQVTVGPVRHAIGRVVGVVGCATDVTETVAAAERAASRLTLEAVPVCVLRLDEQLRVTFANPAALRLVEAEEAEGRALADLAELAPLGELARRAWHLGEVAGTELAARGGRVWRWQAAPEVDPQGNRRGVVLVGWDVTDAVHRVAAAQEEAQRWDAWARAAAELVQTQDLAGLAEGLLRECRRLVPAQHGAAALWDLRRPEDVASSLWGAVSEPAWQRLGEQASVGEAVWLEPVHEEEARLLGLEAGRFQKVLVVPVRGPEVGGVVLLAWTADETQPEDACPVVRLARVAGAVASAVVRQHRAEESAGRLRRQQKLAASVAEASGPADAAERWLRALVEAVGASGAAVYALQGDVWVRAHQAGDRHPAGAFGAEEGAVAEAARTGQVRRLSPTRGDPAFVGDGAEGVVVPLGGPEPWVLAVESAPGRGFSDAELELLEELKGLLAALLRWEGRLAAHEAEAQRYRRLLDAAPVGTVVLDGSRVVRHVSAAAAATLGRGTEELVGRPVLDWVHPEDRAEAAEALSRVYAEPGSTATFTVRLVRQDASTLWAELAASNRLHEPNVAGLVLSVRDVTAPREAEQALAARLADLEALNRSAAALRGLRTTAQAGPRIVAEAAGLLRPDHVSLALVGPDGDSYTVAAVWGSLREAAGTSFPMAGVHGQVLAAGQPFRAEQPPEDDPLLTADAGLGPVLAVPLQAGDRVLGSLLVARAAGSPFGAFDDRDAERLQALAAPAADLLDRLHSVEALEGAYADVVLSLARAMDAHDGVGPGHGAVVAHWAEAVARRMGCSPAEAREVRWAALLHNVGKVAIPEEVLRKAGSLSPEEQALVHRYPVIGEQILEAVPRFRGVAKLVRHHRERYDGTGYPDGLRGEQIPLGARIIAVVDAYNAMTDHRRYRVALSHAEAVAELQRHAGTQFDPAVVRTFVELLEESRSL
jgi:PAS domain S-box-containing protein